MATVKQFNTDDDTQQTSTSAAPTVASVNSSSAPQQQAGAPTSSGRFTNLNKYISANKGSDLGGQIASNVSQQAQNIQKDFSGAQQTAKSQADQNRIQYDPNFVGSMVSDPNQASDQSKVNAFTRMRDAAYKGPQAIEGGQQDVAKASGLQDLASLGQSESGRQALLQNLYGKSGGYSQGQQRFDNLLLTANPQQASQVQQLGNIVNPITSNIQQGQNDFASMVKQYQTDAANASQQTKNALSGAIGGISSSAQQAAQQQSDARKNQYGAIASKLANGTYTNEDLQSLGIDPNTNSYGVSNLGSYLNPVNLDVSANQALNADQFSKLQSLAKLSGNTLSGSSAQDVLNNLGQQYQGGTLANPINFDANKFNSDVATNKGAWDQGFGSASAAQQAAAGTIKDVMGRHLPAEKKVDPTTGQVYMIPGATQGNDTLLSSWLQQYQANPKAFAESVVGDEQGYSGADRDAILQSMKDYTAQQDRLNSLTNTYKPTQVVGNTINQGYAPSFSGIRKVIG